MTEHIELLVRGVHLSSDLLLLVQKKGAAHTFLPGGHLLFGESSEAGLIREIKEELGRSARISRFLGAAEHTWDSRRETHHEVNLVFRVEVEGLHPGQEPSSSEGHLRFFWQPLESLQGANLQPYTLQKLLPVWLEDKREPHWASSFVDSEKMSQRIMTNETSDPPF